MTYTSKEILFVIYDIILVAIITLNFVLAAKTIIDNEIYLTIIFMIFGYVLLSQHTTIKEQRRRKQKLKEQLKRVRQSRTKEVRPWQTKVGYEAVIVKNSFTANLKNLKIKNKKLDFLPLEWYCGYVIIPKTHPLYLKEYFDFENEYILSVHGGITFSGFLDWLSEPSNKNYALGFDCNHADDNMKKCNLAYVKKQCEYLAEQLKRIEEEGVLK